MLSTRSIAAILSLPIAEHATRQVLISAGDLAIEGHRSFKMKSGRRPVAKELAARVVCRSGDRFRGMTLSVGRSAMSMVHSATMLHTGPAKGLASACFDGGVACPEVLP
ncbi:hypothetical protein IB238_07020 [Rhizobium sp. ARZ01]|uniref:hypothetical protein n=1 Tax=Rhizobium sp. ARZ01 TaxID=2769313 RepID=UPI00178018C6|nr:hypothetical protein [Rhizobium sp. ARZ01]MBD9372373.1 hypothetical protein [Rhizobium sp. ARZ01]